MAPVQEIQAGSRLQEAESGWTPAHCAESSSPQMTSFPSASLSPASVARLPLRVFPRFSFCCRFPLIRLPRRFPATLPHSPDHRWHGETSLADQTSGQLDPTTRNNQRSNQSQSISISARNPPGRSYYSVLASLAINPPE